MTETVAKTKNCTGCGACLNICPTKAIEMQADAEGFLFPRINEKQCTDCGLCLKICPAEHPLYEHLQKPACYAAAAQDELRSQSSSGAVFPLLAEDFLQKGGYVSGAAFDENNRVRHIVIGSSEELQKIKGSKYVQSDTGHSYSEIKKLLKENKPVLFSGTPCQVAGLRAFLQKDYENLLTVDIVCHGAPSPVAFEKYAAGMLNKEGEKILAVNFRDKKNGWEPYCLTVKTNHDIYSTNRWKDLFIRAFLENLILRKSCAQCPFARFPRQGDITLGDFWKVEKFSDKLNDGRGTSLVLINSAKGKKYFNDISSKFVFCQKVPLKYAIQGNPSLVSAPVPHPERNCFFENLPKVSFAKNVQYCRNKKYDCAILNFWFGSNYGAMLTCYALQEALKDMGKLPCVINYVPPKVTVAGNLAENFSARYLKLSPPCNSFEDLRRLNNLTKTFIVGSDQVWRYKYMSFLGKNIYQLNFAAPDAKKIAYAVSFGLDHWEGGCEDTLLTKYYISRFDAVSVREDDGVEICRDVFEKDAEHVLDPVFLVDIKKWQRLLDNSQCSGNGYVTTYVLDKSQKAENIINYVCRKFSDVSVVNMVNASRSKTDICAEDWLYHIKNCRFLVTDSFHGMCFAIIFNKPFICLANMNRGYSRFRSVSQMFGLENRCVLDFDEKQIEEILSEEVEYAKVNKIIAKEKERSLMWLKNVLHAQTHEYSPEEKRLMETAEILQEQIFDLRSELQKAQEKMLEKEKLPKLKRKYWQYKLKIWFSFGKKRKKYKLKKRALKEKIRLIRRGNP